jgi:exopolysaccharide biosynthesis polyprenyl glycosylphosphotransferase
MKKTFPGSGRTPVRRCRMVSRFDGRYVSAARSGQLPGSKARERLEFAMRDISLSPIPDQILSEHAVVAGSAASQRRADRISAIREEPPIPCKTVAYAGLKRAFDILFSLFALALCLIPMTVIALLIRLTSAGPVLFRQWRVGKGGRLFQCYKFRSMIADAEARRDLLLHLNESSGPVFKIRRDPRVTPIGRIIRRLSLDELPQFLNVLKGDMSIVGPRPPIPSEVEQYGPRERRRLAVQPGITCLWQVCGRSNVSFERWVELDIHYIDTMSFANDLKIVLQTIPAVLRGSGAY